MRNLIYSLVAFWIMVSCTNLESEMYNVINPNIFPKTEEDAEALVTSAAYTPFNSYHLFYVAWTGVQITTDMTTDIGDCQWNDSYWPDILNVNFTANSSGLNQYYKYVRDISKMTLTLDRIADISMNDEKKVQLNAELHCARGWLAYLLYDLYGPIQIASLEELENTGTEIIIPRKTKEETVLFIETELRAALELPASYVPSDPNYGRFTRGLAYTILMKLYMHEKDWDKAEVCARELMKPEYGYKLVPQYKDIFTLENEKNAETIWACQCDPAVNTQMWLAHVLSSEVPTTNPNIQKWGGFRMTWSFYDTFEPIDKRLEKVTADFIGLDGVHYNKENRGTVLLKGALPIKYGEDPIATGAESQIDWIVYRYADVLTSLSEIIVRKNNAVTQEAVDLLNTVRERAGLKLYVLSDFTDVQDFLDKWLLERGHEFWFEGLRRTDLIRHGKYIEFARKYKDSQTAEDYMTLMPLPQSVINEGKGKIIQNPGY